jgi:hypothetical protein
MTQAEGVAVRAAAADPRFDRCGVGAAVAPPHLPNDLDDTGKVLVYRARERAAEPAAPVVRAVEADGADPLADGVSVVPVAVLGLGFGQEAPPVRIVSTVANVQF